MKLYARISNKNAGYDHDIAQVKDMDETIYHEVMDISMGQSHTSVWLGGLGIFNSVNLEFYDEHKKPVNIFSVPEFNPYLEL